MRLDKKFNFAALREIGIEIHRPHEIGALGDVEIETPTFCASQLRLDTFLRIGAFCNLNANTEIGHTDIGRYVSIAQRCFIGSDKHPTDWLSSSRLFYVPNFRNFGATFQNAQMKCEQFTGTGQITRIGNDVLIANSCIIGRGVTIGNGAIIAAGSVVVKDVPPYAIVGGNPAKVIRMRFPDETIAKLQELAWWDYNAFDFSHLEFKNISNFISEFSKIKSNLQKYSPKKIKNNNMSEFV